MILNPRKRKRKAFGLAFKIMSSYLSLKATKSFRSKASYTSKLNKLHEKNAIRVKDTILELNGLFIKVGQMLSNLTSILPKSYGNVLESLQDNTPHSSFELIKQQVESELSDSIANLFNTFEEIPIASASIGQVHKATLKTGESVAVKIQHSYIKELAKIDLDIIDKIHKKVNKYFNVNGLEHAFEQVKIMIYEELDYTQEAESMTQIKENCSDIDGIFIPKVFTEYSSSTILVSDFCNGVKITNTAKLQEWGINPNGLADKLVYSYCEMILNHGIYHADPHPGNLMVNEKGQLIFLDFGAVGRLTDEMRTNIPTFLQAIISKDSDKIMESMQKMGFVGKGKEKDEATKKIIESLTEFLQDAISMDSINFDNIKQSNLYKLQKELSLKELTSSLDIPKDWILLERTLLLLYGICTNIAPDYSAMETIKPYLKRMVFKNGGLQKVIIDTIKQQATTLFSLPKKTEAFLNKANNGELELEVKGFEKHSKKMYGLGHQILFGIISAIMALGALFANHFEISTYERTFIIISSIFAGMFLLSMWRNRR